jgi:hypothetical protein
MGPYGNACDVWVGQCLIVVDQNKKLHVWRTEYFSCISELIAIISHRIMKDDMCSAPHMRDIRIWIAPLPLRVNILSGLIWNILMTLISLPNTVLNDGIIEEVPAVNERIRSRIVDYKSITTVKIIRLSMSSTVKSNLIFSTLRYINRTRKQLKKIPSIWITTAKVLVLRPSFP